MRCLSSSNRKVETSAGARREIERRRRLGRAAWVALAVAVGIGTRQARSQVTWTGNGSDLLWSDASNWSSAPAIPPNGSDIQFNGGAAAVAGGATVSMSGVSGSAYASGATEIDFNNGAGFTLANLPGFTYMGTIMVQDANAYTINSPTAGGLATTGITTFNIASGGSMNLNGGLTVTGYGTGNLIATGSGTMYLTGGLPSNGSIVNDNAQGGTISTASVANLGTGYLAIQSGGTFQYTGIGSETRTGVLYWNAGAATINVSSSTADLTLAATGGTCNMAFTKSGPGQLTLSNVAVSGTTTISGGTLQLGDGTSSGDGSMTAASIVDGGNLTFDINSNSYAYPGVISSSGSVTKTGTGTVWFSNASTAQSFTGAVTIQQGTLRVSNSAISETFTSAAISNGAFLDMYDANVSIDSLTGQGTVTNSYGNAKTLTIGSAGGTSQFDGVIQNGAGTTYLTKTGAGMFTLTGNNTYTGDTTVTGGTLVLSGSNNYTGVTLITGGILSISSLAGINGNNSGYVAVQTGGTLQYTGTGSETRTGTLYCNSGAATINVSSSTGNLTFAVTGGTLNGTSLTKTGAGQLTLSSASLSMATTISGGTLQVGDGNNGDDGSIGVNILDNANLTFDNFSAGYTYGGVISGSGGVTKTGSGTVWFNNLSNAQTFMGAVTVSQGTLRVSNNQVVESFTSAAVSSNAFLDMYAGNLSLNSLTGLGTVTNGIALAKTLTVGGSSSSSQFDGVIDNSNPIALTKTGTGTFTLTGSNTYSGNTLISGGTLLVNNPSSSSSGTGSGTVTVGTGGTLGGNGYIGTSGTTNGAITIQSGGLIAAGPSSSTTGLLTIYSKSGVTFNGGSGYLWKINSHSGSPGGTTGWDEIATQSNATQGITFTGLATSPFTVYLSGSSGAPANTLTNYVIATDPSAAISIDGSTYANGTVLATTAGGGTLSSLFTVNDTTYYTLSGSESFSFELLGDGPSGQDLVLVGATPEPGSLGLFGTAALGLLRRRRTIGKWTKGNR